MSQTQAGIAFFNCRDSPGAAGRRQRAQRKRHDPGPGARAQREPTHTQKHEAIACSGAVRTSSTTDLVTLAWRVRSSRSAACHAKTRRRADSGSVSDHVTGKHTLTRTQAPASNGPTAARRGARGCAAHRRCVCALRLVRVRSMVALRAACGHRQAAVLTCAAKRPRSKLSSAARSFREEQARTTGPALLARGRPEEGFSAAGPRKDVARKDLARLADGWRARTSKTRATG